MPHPSPAPDVRVAVPCACRLGEGPLWDHRAACILWVDIKGRAVWRHWPERDETRHLPVPEPVGFLALTPDPDRVIAGFRSGLVRLSLSDGRAEPLLSPEPDRPGNRINDGTVGPDGTIYFGTMDDAETAPTGAFYAYDGHRLTRFGDGIVITNGPALSPDGSRLYAVDTRAGRIDSHALAAGSPGPARPLLSIPEDQGHPDGATVDAEGHLWIAHHGGGRLTRFTPEGEVERVIPMPVRTVTKCAFGGPDLTRLYVTSAADPDDPSAGHLFAVEVGIRGQEANIFID